MNGRAGGRKARNRIEGGFVALPHAVLDSAAFQALNFPARGLLLELARQYKGDNNGRLLSTSALLSARGWKSHDVVTRALLELENAGLVHRTVRGGRPNRASWWALTWLALDRHPDFDPGAAEIFRRGAFHRGEPLRPLLKNAALIPPAGAVPAPIVPPRGIGAGAAIPSGGAIGPHSAHPSIPSGGEHIDKPSVVAVRAAA